MQVGEEIRRTQHADDALIGEFIAVRKAHFGDGEHIPVAPRTRAGDGGDRLPLVGAPHLVEDAAKMPLEVRLGNEFEVEPHTAREDGGGDLVRFGGGEDEDGVRGRLFKRL